MHRRTAIAVISLAAPASTKPNDSTVRKGFLGVWKLVSCESKDTRTGTVQYPYGTNPVGRLTYDDGGRMSAQVMKPNRRANVAPTAASSAIAGISADEMREVLAGYIAYFGTFNIDEATRTVIHHVDACLIPSWVGTEQRRAYSFAGRNRLTLAAVRDQAVNTLVWQREGA